MNAIVFEWVVDEIDFHLQKLRHNFP